MMYNFLAWLKRSPLRKCSLCGKVSDKATMVSEEGQWFCDQKHLREFFDYIQEW